MATYRPEFEAALRLFARVSEAMKARGLPRPILVGGAAAEYYSGGAVSTGDIDVCTPAQDAFEEELARHGFIRPIGPGHTSGWLHPELKLGFEVVADVPMDGNVPRDHVLLVENVEPGASFAVISVEDLIADRVGQYASGTARDRLEQARVLFRLNPDVDLAYLDRLVREESFGDHGIQDVRS